MPPTASLSIILPEIPSTVWIPLLSAGATAAIFLLWPGRRSASAPVAPAAAPPAGVFRDSLARYVLYSAIWGLILVAIIVIAAAALPTAWVGEKNQVADTAKQIFNALLPVFGTWVGTLLAFYFAKDNFEAASKSTRDAVKSGSAAAGKLDALYVKDFMLVPGKIVTLPSDLQGSADSKIPLSKLITALQQSQKDRLPLFVGNKASGPAKAVVHLSKIEKYLTGKLLKKPTVEKPEDLCLSDLLTDGLAQPLDAAALAQPLTTEQLAPLFKGSFSLVKESATLAEAKAAMDAMSSAPGVAGNCYDIFVTATGSASEPVLGWITNDIINENAKV